MKDHKCTILVSGVTTFVSRFSPDNHSFVYTASSHGQTVVMRQAWKDGALLGPPKAVLTLPFALPEVYGGNAYDISATSQRTSTPAPAATTIFAISP
jgi:hypothetical protein